MIKRVVLVVIPHLHPPVTPSNIFPMCSPSSHSSPFSYSPYMDEKNVFVKYLPGDINDSSLRELFSPFGSVVSAKVMVDNITGNSLGYGYVIFFVI
jgi:RNA recognition motif-containing protein